MYLAGIDIGTTSISCILGHADHGKVIKTLTRANDAYLAPSSGWEAVQDPQRILSIVHELIEDCHAEWNHVAAVGISCQMHGVLYIDTNGQHVSPLYTWQDRRGDERYSPTHTYASYLQELTGYRLLTGYGLVTHYYNMNNGKVPEAAVFICTIGDYIAMKLCGSSIPVMDASNAASLGLFNLNTLDFDQAAFEKAGMDRRLLPKIAGEAMIAGVTADHKSIVCAIGDNQASFLGAVPVLERTLLFNIGTGSQVSLFSKTFIEHDKLDSRPFPGGGFLLVGASLNGGRSYALLERFFTEICRTFAYFDEHSLYEQMNRLAEEAINEEADHAYAYAGVSFYDALHQPGFIGPKPLINAILNGVADELLDYVKWFPEALINNLITASGSGNGVRKNPGMRQLLQKRVKLPLYLTDVEEAAAYGAAIHAGVGSGLFTDYNDALKKLKH